MLRGGLDLHEWDSLLRENLEWGVITDLSIQYRDAILTATNTSGLDEAEQQFIEAAKQHRDASHSGQRIPWRLRCS